MSPQSPTPISAGSLSSEERLLCVAKTSLLPLPFLFLYHCWRALSLCSAPASHRGGFLVLEYWLSGAWPSVLGPGSWSTGSGLAAPRRVGSSRSEVGPVSPASAGGFFTTEPPGKPPSPSSSLEEQALLSVKGASFRVPGEAFP